MLRWRVEVKQQDGQAGCVCVREGRGGREGLREITWDIHMSGRTDEAILRVDFLFDLATLEGRRKRAQFFKLINGAVGQVVPYTISWCICNAIQNRCTLRYCTVLIVRNVCAGVHMGVLWGGVQIGREHSLHNSVVNVIKNMCFMPGSWEPGAISMKSVRGVVHFLRGGGMAQNPNCLLCFLRIVHVKESVIMEPVCGPS